MDQSEEFQPAQPTTEYFREQVLRKRPYLRIEWCVSVIRSPIQKRRSRTVGCDSGDIPELNSKALRVVTLSDGMTLHNASPDSGFLRRTP